MAPGDSTLTPAMSSPQKQQPSTRQPSLLPAFEPFPSSSPAGGSSNTLPRAAKRKFQDLVDDADSRKYYPTPVPTSSTGIIPSSPPPAEKNSLQYHPHPDPTRVNGHAGHHQTRPAVQRTVSALSERAPLGAVPTLDLPSTGEPVLMGRSSNSSDYQLSANRHISRVHVRASYCAPDAEHENSRVEIECLGWNGVKVHCRGEIVQLSKGEVFVSDPGLVQQSIMVDVQDTRVMLVWPREAEEQQMVEGLRSPPRWGLGVGVGVGNADGEESPSKRRSVSRMEAFGSSPPAMLPTKSSSPGSPSPQHTSTFATTFHADQPVEVYEDRASDEDAGHEQTPTPEIPATASPTKKASTSTLRAQHKELNASHTTQTSEVNDEDFSDHNEENDPIVHSFGPFGDDILSRFSSFQPRSPERARKPLQSSFNAPGLKSLHQGDKGYEKVTRSDPLEGKDVSPIKNHVINQLAFSRIHSLPLSTILSNLPHEMKTVGGTSSASSLKALSNSSSTSSSSAASDRTILTTDGLKTIMDTIPCVGEISREGKDAAGKLLESEFYYMPETDSDEMRRETVMQSLGKTSIRAARKSHKQYYWKRPRN